MLTKKLDAFGLGMLEYYEGRADQHKIVERDDDLVTVGFTTPKKRPPLHGGIYCYCPKKRSGKF